METLEAPRKVHGGTGNTLLSHLLEDGKAKISEGIWRPLNDQDRCSLSRVSKQLQGLTNPGGKQDVKDLDWMIHRAIRFAGGTVKLSNLGSNLGLADAMGKVRKGSHMWKGLKHHLQSSSIFEVREGRSQGGEEVQLRSIDPDKDLEGLGQHL